MRQRFESIHLLFDISYLVQTVLCKKHVQDLQVIVVTEMGGQRKTTLAKMVYSTDPTVIGMFPKRLWVTVSDDFDFIKLFHKLVVSLTSTASHIEGLINNPHRNFIGKKFLLGLDKWDDLKDSLLGVVSNINSMHECVSVSYLVKYRSHEDSWALFKNKHFHVEKFFRSSHLRS